MLKKPDHCNVEFCLKVAESLGREARFNMGNWGSIEYDDEGNTCGTQACIAGHALLVVGVKPEQIEMMFPDDIADKAQELLGLDNRTAQALFDPDPENEDVWKATPSQGREAIMNVIRTGEPKWEEVIS